MLKCYLCGRVIEDYGVVDEPDMVVVELAHRTDAVEWGFERAVDEDYFYAHRECFFSTNRV